MRISTNTIALRQELGTALDSLATERDNNRLLTMELEDEKNAREEELGRAHGQLDIERRRYDQEIANLTKVNQRVFERLDVEAMTRSQLVSLIEQSINEARRKGMLEAEGLLSRHRELESETDIEMMKGVIQTYQGRIAIIEQDKQRKAAQEAQKVTVDTRPLAQKFTALRTEPLSPGWWLQGSPEGQQRATNALPAMTTNGKGELILKKGRSSTYKTFDEKAKLAAQEAHAKSFGIGERVTVPGSTGGTYILERSSLDTYSCTCPAWRFAKEPVQARTCKHLEMYLGTFFEAVRVTEAKKAATASGLCHCGGRLVRGQCQEHTQNWKGPELCTCGRKFASCKAAYNGISIAQRRFGHQPKLESSANSTQHRAQFTASWPLAY